MTFAPIPGHGRANAKVLDEAGLVPWAGDVEHLGALIHEAAAGGRAPLPAPVVPATAVISRLAWAQYEQRIPNGASAVGAAG